MQNYQQFFVISITRLFVHSVFGQFAFRDISEAVGTMERGGQNVGISFCDYNNDNLEDFYVVCPVSYTHLTLPTKRIV